MQNKYKMDWMMMMTMAALDARFVQQDIVDDFMSNDEQAYANKQ